ncbi:class Ib ribonucleoside-diphosphate reductase assembly flavoprotein NrdI [Bartonella henselae]|uniref:Protein NrdI n=1 Tax=Bartonella henselae TaxID=38323 RepID=X5M343_BARHN|nr:class Ib ribonucleoside-diphosphate reductase assembly flavoprotein NrdI [Bartonella henselae]OLL56066.1 protein NrdI [Bartonella henselae]OLL56767.1 protein NrdI [Bartonella henselae]UJM32600.1 class Ib ribonucleoside-diphosphate reductase assembly flavoprotein NrdI [Bartonella henselae]UJM42853.1 class Ib ribonucleoside-diphosphate reductase assembly flavoprotein NrdI [Bartonella henselae]CDO46226.1 ribonucleotide reductase stimulatory protein [Bartonella henselae]
MGLIVYYSSATGNTEYFVSQLDQRLFKIDKKKPSMLVDEPYVLVVPTYADGEGRMAVPKAVIRFLNEDENRKLIRGVIGGGNRNFGRYYSLASKIIAEKCFVPCLYRFELRGTEEDIICVKKGLERFWKQLV